MHESSIKNMIGLKTKYLSHLKDLVILDVGGRGLTNDRSYKRVFPKHKDYYVADIEGGLGVTHVMPSLYELPFEDESIDLVVSGQTLEHVANPFKLVTEMVRVLKTGGYIAVIAPSTGPRHDKKDYWRFMDDAWESISKECGIRSVVNYIDKSSTRWGDNVFLGKK